MQLKLNEIIIGDRQRLDLGDLSDLESLTDPDVGQILPIIVHKTLHGWELVDGRRRLAKATELNWPTIRCEERDQLTPVQKQKMELYADIGRKDRTWQEISLSIYKIHHMQKMEDPGWTTRAMAAFTGYSKGTINYFLRVAEGLDAKPRDEQIWACGSYVEAFKVLIQRQHDQIRGEQEERRQRVNAEQFVMPTVIEETAAHGESLAQNLGITEANVENLPDPNKPVHIYIHGHNKAFVDAKPDIDFMAGCSTAIIVAPGAPYDDPRFWLNIKSALRPEGLCVAWGSRDNTKLSTFAIMPHRLIWNLVSTDYPQVYPRWPYCHNYETALVLGLPEEKPIPWPSNPSTSVCSCHPQGDIGLPPSVVDFSLAGCPPNLAVLLPWDAPVVAVAESGRIPIFFEADPEKFNAKCAALKEFYEQQIPNVVVELRKTE